MGCDKDLRKMGKQSKIRGQGIGEIALMGDDGTYCSTTKRSTSIKKFYWIPQL
jgi:hypothetical protein